MTAKQLMLPASRAFNADGVPVAEAVAYLYETGTSTPANFYSDSALTISIGSSILANAAGRFDPLPYQDSSTAFRLVIKDAEGSVLDDIDPFYFGQSSFNITGAAQAATRTILASIVGTGNASVMLTEAGREGVFTWSSANLSTKVSADTVQGIYVAPATDTTGASGAWVRHPGIDTYAHAHWFGVQGDGVTNDVTNISTASSISSALGYQNLAFKSGSTYLLNTGLTINQSNMAFEARGAIFTSPLSTSNPIINITGSNVTLRGMEILSTANSIAQYQVNVIGTNCTLDGVTIKNSTDQDAQQLYVRYGADGFRAVGCTFSGAAAAIMCMASRFDITDNFFLGASVVDDCIALKATQGITQQGRITNNYMANYSSMLSIGSEIGSVGVNDPNHLYQVRQITFIGNIGMSCASIMYIKPGAIDLYDYRDGIVQDIICSNNILFDPTGIRMLTPIVIQAARGAIVRDVRGRNNVAYGRIGPNGSANYYGEWFYLQDYSSLNPGINAPTITNIDISLDVNDPYDGVAAGGSAPGTPFSSAFKFDKQTSTVGTASNIIVDIKANGTQLGGIVVASGLDNAIYIRRALLSNINTNGSAANGCIQTSSAITLGSEISMSVASGSSGVLYKLNTGGSVTPSLPRQLAANSLVGNNTGSQADSVALTASQAKALLAISTSDVSGLGTSATHPVTDFLQTANVLSDITSTNTAAKNLQAGYVLGQSAAQTSHTGDTVETTLGTITIPANAIGANGHIDFKADFSYTSSANVKTLKIKLGSTILWSSTPTNSTGLTVTLRLANRNATASQRWSAQHLLSTGAISAQSGTATVDTTASTTLTITGQLAVGTETVTAEDIQAILYPKA